jgi:hypothetical protein
LSILIVASLRTPLFLNDWHPLVNRSTTGRKPLLTTTTLATPFLMGRRADTRRKGRRRHDGRPPYRSPQRGRRPVPKRELVVRGIAGDVGLDGNLRVDLDPIDLKAAETLTYKGGGEVVTNRGDGLGRIASIVGTLERPIAIIRVYPDARNLIVKVRGKEVFLG